MGRIIDYYQSLEEQPLPTQTNEVPPRSEDLGYLALAVSPDNPVLAVPDLEKAIGEQGLEAVKKGVASTIREARKKETMDAFLSGQGEGLDFFEAQYVNQHKSDDDLIRGRGLENIALGTPDTSPRGIALYQGFLKQADLQESLSAVRARLNKEAASLDPSAAKAFLNMSTSIVTPQTLLVGTIRDGISKLTGKNYVTSLGDAYEDLKDYLIKQPTSEARMKATEQVIAIFRNAAGFTETNDFIMYDFLRSFGDTLDAVGSEADSLRTLHNVIGFVDTMSFVPFVGAAKVGKALVQGDGKGLVQRSILSAVQAANNMRPSTSSILSNASVANPDLGAKMAAVAVSNPKAAQVLGTTPQEAAGLLLPQAVPILGRDLLAGAPAKTLELIQTFETLGKRLDEIPENTGLYSQKAFDDSTAAVSDLVLEKRGNLVPYSGHSAIGRDNNKNQINYMVVYGNTETKGFSSLASATKGMQRLVDDMATKPLVLDGTKILYLDNVTKELKEVGTETLPKGTQYFVGASGSKPLSVLDARELDTSHIRPAGFIMKWLTGDPHAIFGDLLDNQFIRAVENRQYIKDYLVRLSAPFVTLSNPSKLRVAGLLEEGNKKGVLYDYQTLKEHPLKLSDKEIDGIFSNYAFWEQVYRIKNKELRDTLVADGYKSIGVSTGGVTKTYAGRVLDEVPSNPPKRVWDFRANRSIETSAENLSEMYGKGYKVVKLLRPIDKGDSLGKFEHALLKPGDDIAHLPTEVLDRRTGYIFTAHKDPFYITYKRDTRVDGSVVRGVEEARFTAQSRRQAEDYIKELNALEKEMGRTGSWQMRLDRNLEYGRTPLENDKIDHAKHWWFEERTDKIQRLTGEATPVADPFEALTLATEQVSKKVAIGELVESHIASHKKTFPEFWDSSGSYIGFEAKRLPTSYDIDRLHQSQRLWERIEYFQSMKTTGELRYEQLLNNVDRIFNKVEASDSTTGKLLRKVAGEYGVSSATGRALEASIQKNPTRLLTGYTSAVKIALSPVRMFAVNFLTPLSLVGLDPKAALVAGRDGWPLSFYTIGLRLKETDKVLSDKFIAWGKTLAKAGGTTDLERKAEFLIRTGKFPTVDANVYLLDLNMAIDKAMAQGVPARMWQGIVAPPRALVSVFKKYGHDSGELMHQIWTTLFEIERWGKKNPGVAFDANQRVIDQVSSNARRTSFDMTKAGTLPYQRGMLAPLTQFWAFNHKAALNMLPQVLGGSKHIVGADKARYAIGGLAMFGLEGVGLGAIADSISYHYGWPKMPAVAEDIIRTGWTELAINSAISYAVDDKVDLRWANYMSANSGIISTWTDIAHSLVTTDKSTLSILMGASGTSLPQLGRAARDMYNLFAYGGSVFDTKEQWVKGAKIVGSLVEPLGGLLAYQAELGAQKIAGKYIKLTPLGKEKYESSPYEAGLSKFFKIEPTAEVNFRALQKDSVKYNREIKKAAEQYVNLLAELYSRDPARAVSEGGALSHFLANGNPTLAYKIQKAAQNYLQTQEPMVRKLSRQIVENYSLSPDMFKDVLKKRLVDAGISETEAEAAAERAEAARKDIYRDQK